MILSLINFYTRIRDYALAFAILLVLALSLGLYVSNLKLDKQKLINKNQTEQYQKAAAEATNKAYADKVAKDKEYDEARQKADSNYATLNQRYQSLLLRYKNGLRTVSSTGVSQTSGGTSVAQRTGKDSVFLEGQSTTDMILIPFKDASICAENTAKAQVAHDYFSDIKDK